MAKIRSLFNGVEIEEAQRRRICNRNRRKHAIQRGERCLVIKDPSGNGRKNYCVPCGLDILDHASDELVELKHELE